MNARDVASILSETETLLDLHGESEFRSRAYGRAARALETANIDIEDVVARGGAFGIAGIGKGLEGEIREIIESGYSAQLDELHKATPPGLIEMLRIRGLGAKKVRTIHQQLGIDTLGELEIAARSGRVAELAGFGAKSQANILSGIEDIRKTLGHFRIDQALTSGDHLLKSLQGLGEVSRADFSGRLRRGSEHYESISFVVAANNPSALLAEILEQEVLQQGELDGNTITGATAEGLAVHLHIVAEECYAPMWAWHTGASDHRFMVSVALEANGYNYGEDGLTRDGEPVSIADENELYSLGGMGWIAPELREGIDEVRRSLEGRLPDLVEAPDMKGMLHIHSTWSDGRHAISELAEHVKDLGYRYLLMCDHSKSAFYANGLDERRLADQGREIDEINKAYHPDEFQVLKGTECDILADGTMDFDNDVLASLDAVVASIHSRFELPKEAQTERLCRALENPYVTILGHPTGRLILRRKGYEIDFRRVIETAGRNGKSIEINCNPLRLDLNWRMVRHAIRKGVIVSINPDAHGIHDFDYMRYGLLMARKGGLPRDRTLNAMTLTEFRAFARGGINKVP